MGTRIGSPAEVRPFADGVRTASAARQPSSPGERHEPVFASDPLSRHPAPKPEDAGLPAAPAGRVGSAGLSVVPEGWFRCDTAGARVT